MPNLKTNKIQSFKLEWTGQISEYITDLAWANQPCLAASSALGEVYLWDDKTHQLTLILSPEDTGEQSIDALAFSNDGQFLASAGQEGKVRLWDVSSRTLLTHTWGKEGQWIDHLAWHPITNQLAFSLGRYVQILDVLSQAIVTTLPFDSSSVLDLAWNSLGDRLAIAGNGGIKIWKTNQWDDDPIILETAAACTAIAWSKDGEYLAASCLDQTVLVWRFGDNSPWRMTGFGGKIRTLTWSDIPSGNAPLLAVACLENIIVWKKAESDHEGWLSKVLTVHEDLIKDLAFQPHSLLLGSVGEDGQFLLWSKAKQLSQQLDSVSEGFSRLVWHPLGQKVAVGGQNGELIILTQSQRGQGFG